MKKQISILLSILLICIMTLLPVLSASALPAGTTVYLNAYEAGWDNAYIYGWDCGLHGEFIEMEQTGYEGVYSFTLPQASTDGMQYFFFTNQNTWEGQEQTVPLGTAADKNFYTLYSKDTNGKWTGMWSHMVPAPTDPPTQPPTDPPTNPPTDPPTQPPTEKPYVSAPKSRDFFLNMELKLNTNCYTAAYSVDSSNEIPFTDGTRIMIFNSTILNLFGYDKQGNLLCSETYTYTMEESLDGVIPAGTQLLFDNSASQWENVYVYGWSYGFYGEFWQMTETATPGIYALTLPENVPIRSEFCLFVNQPGWDGSTQTRNIAFPSSNVNTVVPAAGTSPLDVFWTYTTPPAPVPYVMATPSKPFADEMDVMLYTDCENAFYSINGGEDIAYTNATMLHITETSTIMLIGIPPEGDPVIAEYTYTKVGLTTVTATVTGGYDGPIYVYRFGGDQIIPTFNLMTKMGNDYIFSFRGASRVIFTTTNDWATAEKLNTDEPLIAIGATAHFDLFHP